MTQMLGIDTSYWKRDIVNSSVHADFVWTKATEGNYFVDTSCDPIVQWAISTGKKWGVFHFATNLVTDAITEANYFVDNCLGYIGKGLLVLDTENYTWSDGTHANNPGNVTWAKAWLDHVFSRTGVKPLVYMSYSVRTENNWDEVIAADYGLIVAAYPLNNTPVANYGMDFSKDPNPSWGAVGDVMWQFTSTGRLDGYNGNLDCDIFYGDAATWDAYATPRPAVQQSATPQPTTAPTTTPVPDPIQVAPAPLPPITPEPVSPPPSKGTAIDVVVKNPIPVYTPPKVIQPTVSKDSVYTVGVRDIAYMLGKYNKFLIAIGGSIVTFLLQQYGSTAIVKDIVLALTALGVFQIKNNPPD